ncbi:hypothetical protein CR152_27840 [Massilia violaceinigra]|uniref:Uncharacterized protein n=1 Tax=Massilia violaceinigra TaxID=2045208 RepID=A0A2D2DSD9_9BURK|nr:hypothetical protein [Massilia violaceinigra]ATQ77889.1 hypothetical protein CR152_27840 [Massilia violaceinigra]
MTTVDHTRITTLIEQRIRDEVRDESREAVDAFASVIEAELYKLGVYAPLTNMYELIEQVRTKHIENMVNKRIVDLVERLVQGEQVPAQSVVVTSERALTAQQVERIKKGMLDDLPAGCKVAVLHGGLTVGAVV